MIIAIVCTGFRIYWKMMGKWTYLRHTPHSNQIINLKNKNEVDMLGSGISHRFRWRPVGSQYWCERVRDDKLFIDNIKSSDWWKKHLREKLNHMRFQRYDQSSWNRPPRCKFLGSIILESLHLPHHFFTFFPLTLILKQLTLRSDISSAPKNWRVRLRLPWSLRYKLSKSLSFLS